VTEPRSSALVRHEIAVEREALARSVEQLRGRLAETANVRRQIGSRARVLAPASFAAGFVLAGGLRATLRYVASSVRERF
jgi:hypothetical protein